MSSCSSFLPDLLSTLSLLSWLCAQLPQIVANYKTKSTEGISPVFLLLWFAGDFLSFTSCLLNDVTLLFQIYLSLFFLANDVTLCVQYYYYTSVYPRQHPVYLKVEALTPGPAEQGTATPRAIPMAANPSEPLLSSLESSVSSKSPVSITFGLVTTAAALHLALASAMSLENVPAGTDTANFKEILGLVLAWACTVVYVSSRCPQLYKNYQRKSVGGISPLLFASALIGNLTYTLSVLTSCEFLEAADKKVFFMRQLPYLLGSSGTIVFDMAYFYQRHIYRHNRKETLVMPLESWDD